MDARITWPDEARTNAPSFFDLLDGAGEDIDRLEGHAAEYDEMSRRKLRVAEYAQKFRIEDVPEGTRLVVFTEDDNNGEPESEPKVQMRVEPK